jgi:prepilin-type N-terminal cleavage/methylation domain-containing protein
MTRRRQRGMTLVEMLVVLSLMAVLLGFTGVCMHGMFRAQARLDDNTQRRASLERLGLQLRTDAHAALRARLQDDQDTTVLVLTTADSREIEYRAEAADVDRTVRQADAVLHRDTFRMPGVAGIEWEVSDVQPQVVSLHVSVAERGGKQATGASLGIESVVGLRSRRSQIPAPFKPAEQGGDEP